MTTNREISGLLSELNRRLGSHYGDRLRGCYLYGSYARGDAQAESDLDILIILDEIHDYWQEVEDTSGIVSELSLAHGITISPVRLREAEWKEGDSPFVRSVREEAVPL